MNWETEPFNLCQGLKAADNVCIYAAKRTSWKTHSVL